MAELIATIILVSSLLGMGVILYRKIPVLVELPEVPGKINLKENFLKLRKKIKVLNPFKYLLDEVFLQKILSRIRILTLKIENKTASWLQKLRERSLKKKVQENDNYWKELKDSAKKGKR